jgi:MoxR-like ATPase
LSGWRIAGHALLRGVSGLATTLLVRKLAETMSLKFRRIRFTPYLTPMDITGAGNDSGEEVQPCYARLEFLS